MCLTYATLGVMATHFYLTPKWNANDIPATGTVTNCIGAAKLDGLGKSSSLNSLKWLIVTLKPYFAYETFLIALYQNTRGRKFNVRYIKELQIKI